MTKIISSLNEISAKYEAAFVDLWGCVHNGITAFPEAVAALQEFRRSGKTVILVTNAPRPWDSVQKQIDGMGIPRDAYDAIATSGDSARAATFRGIIGSKIHFIGQDFENTFFIKPDVVEDAVSIDLVSLNEAEGIVCCGPRDPLASLDEYRGDFLQAKQMGLKLVCANPDIVVDRGETREWCAGALAQMYTEMGGESLYFGKPHPPIYDLARRHLAALGKDVPDSAIIAIGDGVITDVAGAMGEDLDVIFISGGLAREDTKTAHSPEPTALKQFLELNQANAQYAMGMLR